MPHRVAFLGFTESERHALSSYFRLAHNRSPSYAHVATLTDADLLVADADHGPSVQLVLVTERLGETVFIGAQAPPGSAAWMRRPIDALQVMRELDGVVARLMPGQAARDDGGEHTTIIQAMRRRRETAPEPEAAGAQGLLGDLPFSAAVPAATARATAPAASAWPAETAPAPPPAPALDDDPREEPPAHFDALPSVPGPLTLRDPPTPAAGEPGGPPLPEHFPGAEGLVGHEPPLPVPPGAWTEDLAALHGLPVLRELAPAPAAPPSPTPSPLPAPAPAPAPAPPPAPPPAPAPAAVTRPAPTAAEMPPKPAAAVVPAPAAAPAKAPKPPKLPKASLLPGKPRALMVDDSAIALLFLEKRLERWQIQTDHASNSQAALALMAQNSYDLVFLDVELGTDSALDGLGLCRQIKQTPASMNALVVMVSAHHSELDRVRGSLAGCDAYLGKPLDEAELQRLLQRQGLRARSEAGPVAR